MRLGNLNGRAVLVTATGAVDVADASDGRFASDPMAVLGQWDDFRRWAATVPTQGGRPFDEVELGPPVPRPRQVFAVALNYRPHAAEAGFRAPDLPLVFTKFPSCITGPFAEVELPAGNVDWEIELVAVFGRHARRVVAADAWEVLAGVTVGQDLSERTLQLAGSPPQFGLAKSHPGFGPIGPMLVTPDELLDRDDLALRAELDGEVVQQDRSSSMIFSVAELVAFVTGVCAVEPGDLLFTGTPAGVGNRRTPPRFLAPGEMLTSSIDGVGVLRTTFVGADGSR